MRRFNSADRSGCSPARSARKTAIAVLAVGPIWLGGVAGGQSPAESSPHIADTIAAPGIIRADSMTANHSSILLSEAGSEGTAPEATTSEAETAGSSNESILTPTGDRLRVEFGNGDSGGFTYGFGSQLPEPTALVGGTRTQTLSATAQRDLFFPIAGYLQQGLGSDRRLLLELQGDLDAVAADLSFSIAPEALPGSLSLNVQSQSNLLAAFEGGETEVSLPSDAEPHVNQWGVGLEYVQSLTSQVDLASGVNYRVVSVRSGAFTNNVVPTDELGNPVTVSGDGIDPLLTFDLAAVLNAVDDRAFPTRGTRLRLGFTQSIPIGDADINLTRLGGNLSQFIPLFGSSNPHTLVLNVQGGTIFNDVPPYEAFSLGSSQTVRGFEDGEIGTGSSFIQASLEYRYPIASFQVLGFDIDLRGSAFVDYGDTLGTQDDVIGQPGTVRDKDGEGLGYGLGIHFQTAFGLFRLEPSLSDDGDFNLHFTAGDRF